MREIKFRAWDKIWDNTKQQDENSMKYSEQVYNWWQNDKNRYILMQYTGLKDKNGKEIYEGDIVQSKEDNIIGNIVFFCGAFCFGIENKIPSALSGQNSMLEIIGNIYENPELLKS